MKTLLKNIRYLWRNDLEANETAICDIIIKLRDKVIEELSDPPTRSGAGGYKDVPIKSFIPETTITERPSSVLDMDVHEFFKAEHKPILTAKARFVMYRNKVTTVSHLTTCSEKELKVEGYGKETFDYIRYILGKHGLKLAGLKQPCTPETCFYKNPELWGNNRKDYV
jgi:hypothetical protein